MTADLIEIAPEKTAKQNLEQWAIDNGKCSLVCYGSGVADIDYMFFSDENFKPEEAFKFQNPGIIYAWNGSRACLVIAGTEFFDIALHRPELKDEVFANRADMLRNSPKPVVWVCDVHGLKSRVEKHIAETERKKMTDEEIIATLKGYFVNLKFLQRKIFSGPLHARFLLLHSVEPTLFQLARQYDLRRGGKGKWKGRDAEKLFTSNQLKMLSVSGALDSLSLAKELYGSVVQVKFWCKELKIPVPSFLENITW